jgi:peptidoglycan/xylan/chitin deacetylase (PgdA/CDA1 family)
MRGRSVSVMSSSSDPAVPCDAMTAEDVTDRVMALAPVRAAALAATGGRLRVLGYHGITRPEVLDRQLGLLRRHYHPIALADVVAALDGAPLPRRAVWVTFDDGDPSVVDVALPLLRRHEVRATMFVCPSVIDSDDPLWWQALDDEREIARLKRASDAERRAAVATTTRRVPQLTTEQLREFARDGDIGNHTWSHPMLDRCDDDEQRRQVRAAHEWLASTLGTAPIAFAYPNGNVAAAAGAELAALGYRVALLHDHRLASLDTPLAMSRLRAGDHVTDARFGAIVAGLHPLVHGARGRVRGPR